MAGARVLLVLSAASAVASPGGGDPRLTGYLAAEGFAVTIAADFPAVVNPVTMSFGEDGTLYVAEWTPGDGRNDRIKALRSTKGDGIFDEVKVIAADLYLPSGILVHDGWLYVPQDEELWRLRLGPEGLHPETRQVLVRGFHNDHSHHRLSGITLGPDGWLYLTTGDSDTEAVGLDGSRATIRRSGGVVRCRPDGSHVEVFASGMRNPFGNVAFDKGLNAFHTDNDNEDGSKYQGCRLLHVVDEGDYGWRLRYGARCCAPDHARGAWYGERPGRLPRVLDTGRGSPAGITVINSPAFPPALQNTLVYPDVFRRLVRLYHVAPAGGTFTVTDEVPLLQVRGPDEGLFRPSDAEIGPDGALYVLDWRTDSGGAGRLSGDDRHGRIYRITWAGDAKTPALPTRPFDTWASLRRLSDSALIDRLGSADFWERVYAQRELVRRGPAVRKALRTAATDHGRSVTARLHALLAATDPWDDESQSLCLSLLRSRPDGESVLVGWAADLLGRNAPPGSGRAELARVAPSPALDRRLALARGRLDPGGFRSLVVTLARRRLAPADPFAKDGIYRALDRGGAGAVRAVEALCASPDRRRRGACLAALEGMRGPEAAAALGRAATSAPLTESERAEALAALPATAHAEVAGAIGAWLARSPAASDHVRTIALNSLASIAEQDDTPAQRAAPIACALLGNSKPTVQLQLAAADLAVRLRAPCAREPLVRLARHAPEERVRLAAIRGLPAFAPAEVREVLIALSGPNEPEVIRAQALRSLARADYEPAAKRALDALTDEAAAVRGEAIAILGQKPAYTAELANRAIGGTLRREDVPRVLEVVRRSSDPRVRARLGEILGNAATGESKDTATLAAAARQMGDARRGQQLFLKREVTGCIQCHELEGIGGGVGPSLTKVYDTLTVEKIIESILEPSKEIKEAFETHDLQLKDGRILSGRLLAQNASAVVLRDATGQDVRVPRVEIGQMVRSAVSLMPEGTTSQLSPLEFADLVAFLKSRQAQEDLRERKARAAP